MEPGVGGGKRLWLNRLLWSKCGPVVGCGSIAVQSATDSGAGEADVVLSDAEKYLQFFMGALE